MIPRDARTLKPWLVEVCRRVSIQETQPVALRDIEPGDIVYIGGGHWRALLVADSDDPEKVAGASLRNADMTESQIRDVERGVCVLMHLTWTY